METSLLIHSLEKKTSIAKIMKEREEKKTFMKDYKNYKFSKEEFIIHFLSPISLLKESKYILGTIDKL